MNSPTLTGPHVELRLMTASDAPGLVAAAADGELWNLKITVVPSAATIDAYVASALQGYVAGTALPFVIVAHQSGRLIGSTRYWKIDRQNRKLEIGHTWLAKSWQRTVANTECKHLLLTHAFETMNCVRVQFQTDERNAISRAAILRLGAKEEGILRKERIMPDGWVRNSVRFSIIDTEWPEVKLGLERRMAR
jgi:RimJ/RimL family protein N-acetyltransferase